MTDLDREIVGRVKCRVGAHTGIFIPGVSTKICPYCEGSGFEPVKVWTQCAYCGDTIEAPNETENRLFQRVLGEVTDLPVVIFTPTKEETRKYGGNTKRNPDQLAAIRRVITGDSSIQRLEAMYNAMWRG